MWARVRSVRTALTARNDFEAAWRKSWFSTASNTLPTWCDRESHRRRRVDAHPWNSVQSTG
jgi:hypothetical protein